MAQEMTIDPAMLISVLPASYTPIAGIL